MANFTLTSEVEVKCVCHECGADLDVYDGTAEKGVEALRVKPCEVCMDEHYEMGKDDAHE